MNLPLRLPGHLEPGTVVVLGVPSDENSSFMRGPALAPARIREVLHAGSTNLCAENGTDLGVEARFQDAGDLQLDGSSGATVGSSGATVGSSGATAGVEFETIERAVASLLGKGAYVLSLGGDHAITYPIVRAYAREYSDLNILHVDAHPDLYDEYEGNRYSNACPFARIMEEGLAARLVQVGIRAMTPHQRAQAGRFGVEVVEMRQWQPAFRPEFQGPVYLSVDMDGLDPAFAPGVSHHEPGGLSTRDVIRLIQDLRAPIVGADIVEFNPSRDPVGITAMAAAKLLKEIAACMIAGT